MGRLQFLKDKKFYLNLLIILMLCVGLLFLTFWLLDKYTRHDDVYTMPDFVGMDFHQVQREHSKDFHFIVIDSIYPKGQEPGSIFQQDPLPGSKIKRGRNVYTIVVAVTPEMTIMPDLKGISLREALSRIESSGLDVDHLDFVEYSYKNNVIEQYYEGRPIETGTELVKGSKINLKVGIGQDKYTVKVPNLIGKAASDVKHILNLSGLNLGKEVFEDRDSIQYMCVRRMTPGPSSGAVEPGTFVDIWYHSNRTLDYNKQMKELLHEDSIANLLPPAVDSLVELEEPIDTTAIPENNNDDEDDF